MLRQNAKTHNFKCKKSQIIGSKEMSSLRAPGLRVLFREISATRQAVVVRAVSRDLSRSLFPGTLTRHTHARQVTARPTTDSLVGPRNPVPTSPSRQYRVQCSPLQFRRHAWLLPNSRVDSLSCT